MQRDDKGRALMRVFCDAPGDDCVSRRVPGGCNAPCPVGSSNGLADSWLLASLMNIPRICGGLSRASDAYSSRSCSPESPTRKKRASTRLSRISSMPARFRSAGAVSRPLNNDRPAYDFSLTDPGGSFDNWMNSLITGRSSKGLLDWRDGECTSGEYIIG